MNIIKIKKWLVFYIGFLLFAHFSFAQSSSQFKKDLIEILKRSSNDGLKTSLIYQIYDAKSSEKLIDQTQMFYIVKGNQYYLDNKMLTFYCNNRFNLIKVKNHKQLLVYKPGNEKMQLKQLLLPDSNLMNSIKSIDLVTDSGGIHTYNIQFKDSEPFLSWVLTLNVKENCLIENKVLYRRSMNSLFGVSSYQGNSNITPLIVIQFKNSSVPEDLDLQKIFASEIGEFSKRRIELTPAYKSYKVINYLSIN